MFAVDDIDETLGRRRKRGAQIVGDVVWHQDSYRLCYIRGPEGLLIGLAQELNSGRCAQAEDKSSTQGGDR
jgi:predicted enzyme related to lactoylglutathione lyase